MSESWRPPAGDPYVGLSDDARVSEAVRARSQERWLRHQAVESATFVGTLRDLAERGMWLTLHCATGRSYHGRLRGIGPDHVRMEAANGQVAYLALGGVVAVRPDPIEAPGDTAGADEPETGRLLDEVLADVVERRPNVLVVPEGGGEVFKGRLSAVGEDVATLHVDERERSALLLRLSAIAELVITD